MEPMRAQVLCLGAIRRPSRFRREFLACRSAAASPLCALCVLCGDLLSTGCATAESAERAEEGQPPSWRVFGRRSRFHQEALECGSVTLLSLCVLRDDWLSTRL